jgi:hypothetical protein
MWSWITTTNTKTGIMDYGSAVTLGEEQFNLLRKADFCKALSL